MHQHKAWIVAVDMGYGHQRAAFPLRHLSPTGKVVIANNYEGIPNRDKNLWQKSRKIYETISRLKNVPIMGEWIFGAMDYLQRIPDFYPRRDLSNPSMQVKAMYSWIRRKKWGKDLVDYLNHEGDGIPLVTTFFVSAFMAEEHVYNGEIYCVICDADCSRAWAPFNPKKSRIKYLAPCRRVVERLKLYGVRENQIFLTGFPLPEENTGGDNLKIVKGNLAERVINLDPNHYYRQKYGSTVKQFLHDIKLEEKHHHPLTLTFAVGGAGAQRQLGCEMLASLKQKLLKNEINLNLVAGSRNDVYLYFKNNIKEEGLEKILGENLQIVFNVDKEDYFEQFSRVLCSTDVLWTKPSEMVFYCALGLPIIMAPSVGAQEDYNRLWLKTIGAGISQNNPRYTREWLFDWVNSGWLAEAAMSGFLDGRQFGVKNITDVIFNGVTEPAKNYQLL
jgi:hypothetical protein